MVLAGGEQTVATRSRWTGGVRCGCLKVSASGIIRSCTRSAAGPASTATLAQVGYTSFAVYMHNRLMTDDTQLFLSFHPSDFHSNISYLQNALQQISSWMTANLLTLNSSETEFLLIGLKQQLSKIHDCSLTTTHSARNLGFIFYVIF